MDVSRVPAGSIVVGFDGSPWSDSALEWGIDQAAAEQRALVIVHAIDAVRAPTAGLYAASGLDPLQPLDETRAAAQLLLDDAVARAREREPSLDVHSLLRVLDPRSILLELGERAAMIVVGSRGHGPVASLVLGSVSVSVSRHSACPVVVCHTTGPAGPLRRVLVGVDGTPSSRAAIELAYRLASFRRAGLTVLHCFRTAGPVTVSPPAGPGPDQAAERALVSESLAGMAETYPDVDVEVRLASGSAEQALTDATSEADLVVVGHQRSGLLHELIRDSVASAVLEHALGTVAVAPSTALVGTGGQR